MIDEFKKILEQVSGPTDISTILLAGIIGGVIDAAFNPFGFFTWQETTLVCASGALGVKKGAEAGVAKWRERKARKQKPDKERARAEKLLEMLSSDENDKRRQAIARRLRSDLELFASGIIEADDLKAGVNEAIKAYRDHSQNAEGSV